jgi:hypothetical protein
LSNVLESENINVDALVKGKSDIGGTSLSVRFEWVQYERTLKNLGLLLGFDIVNFELKWTPTLISSNLEINLKTKLKIEEELINL